MSKNLREQVKDFLIQTDVPLSTIAKKANVPYGIVYRLKNTDSDSLSEHVEKLYVYFTKSPIVKDEQG